MKSCVVVGISGGVAAFKSVQLVSDLVKKGYDVEVIMTKNATQFIQPLQFESLTQHKVMVDTFDRSFEYSTEHISIAKKADVFVIAPATANILSKVVHGLADDMLSTTFLAANCPKLLAPAMNTQMYLNPITQDNLKLCEKYGMQLISPTCGHLACGDQGVGKMADIDTIKEAIEMALVKDKKLANKKVLISAGPTREALDPVRFITNHSTGKMGYALARAARNMGGDVTLVSGPVALKAPMNVTTIPVNSASDMANAMLQHFQEADIIICTAAVADFTPEQVSEEKIKKEGHSLTLPLKSTTDILKTIGEQKTHQKLIGFAMESENEVENGKKKLLSKNCDLLVVNSLRNVGAGFGCDTNIVTLLTQNEQFDYEIMPKEELAYIILNKALEV